MNVIYQIIDSKVFSVYDQTIKSVDGSDSIALDMC